MRWAWVVLAMAPLTGGCVSTVWNVATAPVRAGAQVIDWTTTSQSEADRNYGRKMRKAEEREGTANHRDSNTTTQADLVAEAREVEADDFSDLDVDSTCGHGGVQELHRMHPVQLLP